jgi:hypothetical protein
MRISGTAEGLPDSGFTLVVTANEVEIARSRVLVHEAVWQVDLLHGYNGVTVETTIAALSSDPALTEAYDRTLIAVGGLAYRPDGSMARMTSNTNEGTLGGDIIRVEGMASGLAQNQLVVRLLTPEDGLISESIISVNNPFVVDEMPWSADLSREEFTGAAVLELSDLSGQILESQSVTVESAAG